MSSLPSATSKPVHSNTGQTSSKERETSFRPSQSGPTEVVNRVSMFDSESEGEEEVKEKSAAVTGGIIECSFYLLVHSDILVCNRHI